MPLSVVGCCSKPMIHTATKPRGIVAGHDGALLNADYMIKHCVDSAGGWLSWPQKNARGQASVKTSKQVTRDIARFEYDHPTVERELINIPLNTISYISRARQEWSSSRVKFEAYDRTFILVCVDPIIIVDVPLTTQRIYSDNLHFNDNYSGLHEVLANGVVITETVPVIDGSRWFIIDRYKSKDSAIHSIDSSSTQIIINTYWGQLNLYRSADHWYLDPN